MKQEKDVSNPTNIELALKLAKENFAKKAPELMAERAGGEFEKVNCGNSLISVSFLGQDYTLVHPGGGIEFPDHHKVAVIAHILLLHYLISASGSPIKGEIVSFKGIPGGDKYFPVFKKRVEMPVLNAWGVDPEGFENACSSLGGEKVNMGDAAFRFQAFPRVPVTYVYWKEEEEFPSSLQVLYDSSIREYLPLEDIVFLSEMLSWKIARFK